MPHSIKLLPFNRLHMFDYERGQITMRFDKKLVKGNDSRFEKCKFSRHFLQILTWLQACQRTSSFIRSEKIGVQSDRLIQV